MCRLAAGWFDAGPRELAWDGRDEAGAQVPAGVYFAELRTREGTVRVPLVRLR